MHRHSEISSAEVPADKVSELGITYTVIGEVTDSAAIEYNDVKIALDEAVSAWEETLEKVFPTNPERKDRMRRWRQDYMIHLIFISVTTR